MKVILEFLGTLRSEFGTDSIEVFIEGSEAPTLKELLKYLLNKLPKLSAAVSYDGTLSTSYIAFINGIDYMLLGGYDYNVKDGDKITFVPITHGG